MRYDVFEIQPVDMYNFSVELGQLVYISGSCEMTNMECSVLGFCLKCVLNVQPY